MRTCLAFLGIVALSIAWSSDAAAAPGDAKGASAEEIQKLIQQLADAKFEVRDKAKKRLAEIGKPALPALQAATKDSDPQVKESAESLIKEITTAADKKGREALDKFLAKFKGAEGGQIIAVTEDGVDKVFPAQTFYVLRFRQFPVARVLPEGLQANNLLIVQPDGSVEQVVDQKALFKFFKANAGPIKEDAQAKDVTRAWLRLAQEFHQDGFFKFSIPDDALTVAPEKDGKKAAGKFTTTGGNKGEISVTFTIDSAGKLADMSEAGKLIPGPRPICQATKLLDPDPIVRGMAEQTIVIMGRECKGYLDEQRAKASPELQKAIDRIWQRILDEDR